MRSIASAFNRGRGGKSPESASASVASASSQSHSAHTSTLLPAPAPRLPKMRSITLSSKAPKTPLETDAPRVRPVLTTGSSASSDGSGSLRTPDDETTTFPKAAEADRERDKKRWSAWFRRKSSSGKDSPPADEPNFASVGRASSAGMPAPSLGPASQGARRNMSDSDEDDEDSEGESSEYHQDNARSLRPPAARALPSQANFLQAKANFRTLLRNSLVPTASHPPLVDVSSPGRFPRSASTSVQNQHTPSLESTMHIRRILQRLERGNLSATDMQFIASLGKRKVAARKASDRRFDDDMASFTAMRVGCYSRGLRMWASRPCFEQRFQVWMPDAEEQVAPSQVMGVGRGLAVLDLEVSEWLEAMAGLLLDDQAFDDTIFPQVPVPRSAPARSATKISPQLPPPPRPSSISTRSTLSLSSPSPLRLEQGPPAVPVLTPVSSMTSLATPLQSSPPVLVTSASRSPPSRPSPRRNSVDQDARHDDRDPYEDVPLAYAMQAKKKREEKERFLKTEREKRVKFADEKKNREEEAKPRLEEERRKAEEARRAREERRKSILAEEVVAARKRIETARLGAESYTNIREANERERTSTRAYNRPAYDSTQAQAPQPSQTRAPSLTRFSKSTENLSTKPSSSSSRPPSIASGFKDEKRQSIVLSGHNPSRVSLESSRPALTSRKSLPPESGYAESSRPASVMSEAGSKRMSLPRVNSAPMQVPVMMYPMNPMLPMNVVPPVPPLPYAMNPVWGMGNMGHMGNMGGMNGMNMNMGMGMNMNMNMSMPLLPPNAPFMMHSSGRAPSPTSSRNSPNHSPNHSPKRQSTTPLPSSSSSKSQQSRSSRHQRYYSGDVPRMSSSPADAPPVPLRSASYSPRLPSSSQPHDHKSQRHSPPQPGSSPSQHQIPDNNNNKRRTTMM